MKQDLILHIMNNIDHSLLKKGSCINDNEFSGKWMKNFVGRSYSYSIDDGSEDKKAKGTKKWVLKRKNKF